MTKFEWEVILRFMGASPQEIKDACSCGWGGCGDERYPPNEEDLTMAQRGDGMLFWYP